MAPTPQGTPNAPYTPDNFWSTEYLELPASPNTPLHTLTPQTDSLHPMPIPMMPLYPFCVPEYLEWTASLLNTPLTPPTPPDTPKRPPTPPKSPQCPYTLMSTFYSPFLISLST